MGTEKRERQKAARQQKIQELRRAENRSTKFSKGLKIGGAIVAFVIFAVAFALLTRDDNGDDDVATDDASSDGTAPADTSPDDTAEGDDGVTGDEAPEGNTCPDRSGPVGEMSWDAPPEMMLEEGVSYGAVIQTSLGEMELELFAEDAPLAVNNFVFLARQGYFDGVSFHRIIEGFMIQGGDPVGTGMGGPGYCFADELDTVATHGMERGRLAMANGGPDTNGSQFFIVHGEAGHLSTHTVFGTVTEGFDTLDAIAGVEVGPGDAPVEPVTITSVDIQESA